MDNEFFDEHDGGFILHPAGYLNALHTESKQHSTIYTPEKKLKSPYNRPLIRIDDDKTIIRYESMFDAVEAMGFNINVFRIDRIVRAIDRNCKCCGFKWRYPRNDKDGKVKH